MAKDTCPYCESTDTCKAPIKYQPTSGFQFRHNQICDECQVVWTPATPMSVAILFLFITSVAFIGLTIAVGFIFYAVFISQKAEFTFGPAIGLVALASWISCGWGLFWQAVKLLKPSNQGVRIIQPPAESPSGIDNANTPPPPPTIIPQSQTHPALSQNELVCPLCSSILSTETLKAELDDAIRCPKCNGFFKGETGESSRNDENR